MHSKEIKYYSLREEKEGGRSFQTTQQNIRLHINNRYKKEYSQKHGSTEQLQEKHHKNRRDMLFLIRRKIAFDFPVGNSL